MKTGLTLKGLRHAYLGRTVLDHIDLEVSASEIVALVGPSGSGKSTLVHLAADLLTPIGGRVERNYKRHAMIFQEPRLLPWATAAENIAYPLRISGTSRREARAKLKTVAAKVALQPEDLEKYPGELSGGMRQRCAIARALIVAPDFIYFDEPFTALDVALKRRMQDLVIAATQSSSFGGIFVTHDLMEAARVAHRVAVLDVGGAGIVGERLVPGTPGMRDDAAVFTLSQRWAREDPAFRHIHDVDERMSR
ncbi:ABC transporter ATP-binding protein [Martelella soudanensis]|uniref:ABC transporter ATP-binding protein n=1 Tax=unclassified Martelella TaxID=2629616 RepID=UPI0015DFBBBF|nr:MULTISPECIES: ATP-binding cassette domain-containing protein [unclassified Martelella]